MAIEKKERYLVTMEDGSCKNALAATFQEVLQMFGEENVCKIEKWDYEEPEK